MNLSATHVIVGAGPIGSGTALRLADAGHRVVVVTRSGSGPEHAGIELVAADAADQARLTEIAVGAHAIYNCANPPYHRWATDWPPLAASLLGAAETTGARLVTMSNLYLYAADSSPMRASDPLDPPSKKGAIRVQMWKDALAAHEAGRVSVTEARASDYFGPGLGQNGHFGDRVMPKLIAGKSVSVIGRSDVAHSWSYVGDVCDTLVVLGTDDRALGRAWHVPTHPPMSAQQLADEVSRVAGYGAATVKTMPNVALKLAGVFSKPIREIGEMLYQFTAPFELDSSDTTATFGLEATPLSVQIDATITSYGVSAPQVAVSAV
jgi:nucleoside-diphosphate-sugar epimerase